MGERMDVVQHAVAPVVESLGLELYDLEVLGAGRNRVIRVVIDRDGGVDLDAITAATEAVSPVLDHDPKVDAVLRGSYTLEVTSPGLERTLREPRHFQRALGATVSVKTGQGSDATRRRGVLASVDDSGFELEADGRRERIDYADVIQARTVFEWGAQEKPGRKQKVSS
jgi:ribosome maturation factor RimP